jgi:hypothetical protein
MSDETNPAGDGWTYTQDGAQRIPVHCGGQALDLDLGEWECRACDDVIHVRRIPGWTPRVNTAPAPTTPRVGSTTRG